MGILFIIILLRFVHIVYLYSSFVSNAIYISLCNSSQFYLSILPLIHADVISRFVLLWIMLLQTFLYISCCAYIPYSFSFNHSTHLNYPHPEPCIKNICLLSFLPRTWLSISSLTSRMCLEFQHSSKRYNFSLLNLLILSFPMNLFNTKKQWQAVFALFGKLLKNKLKFLVGRKNTF